MADEWTQAAQARNDFADMVEALSPEQVADGTTLCEGWSPHLVTAHMVTFVDVPLPKFMFNVLKHGFKFDAASDSMARKIGERPNADLLATLRAKAGKKSAMPGFPEGLTVADSVVHQQDVRRGLELDGAPDPKLVETALEFLTTDKQAKLLLNDKDALNGLRFEATDLDWSHGEGELVSGPGEALMMAMVRRNTADELTGDGVATLTARQAAAK